LRGRETTVLGSWVGGACGCWSDACWASWLAARQDCDLCQRDRKSRHRVVNSPDDRKHLEEHFLTAPAIFPNDDIKHEVDETRAQIYAVQAEQAITWSVAKDAPTNEVLAKKQNIVAEKAAWLTRHDRDCGDPYGVLPLVEGMPVSLTGHIDRNPEKNLLRGRIGYVDSWVLGEREDSVFEDDARFLLYPPKALLVRYYDWAERDDALVQEPCAWCMEGMDECGVYPIKPWKRPWFLDLTRQPAAAGGAVSGALGTRVLLDRAQRARCDLGVGHYRFVDRSRSERARQLYGRDPGQNPPRLADLQELRPGTFRER
jgi:hypothetical protein